MTQEEGSCFSRLVEQLARAAVPPEVIEMIRGGRWALSRARGRRCVNRFSGRFRIYCLTAGMGRPSVSAHTTWFRCSEFDDSRAGHIPLGHADFVQKKLAEGAHDHASDLQCAWLVLLFCAASRANHVIRVVHPAFSFQFAHDVGIRQCLQEFLQ